MSESPGDGARAGSGAGSADTPATPSFARLEVIGGPAAGTTILVEDELVMGRHGEGPARLGDDPEISRQHARISREADGVYAIEDLGSSNGTFVKGLRIAGPELLTAGDTIELGGTVLVVNEIHPPARPEPAPYPSREPALRPECGTIVAPAARTPAEPQPQPVPAPAPVSTQPPTGAQEPITADLTERAVRTPPAAVEEAEPAAETPPLTDEAPPTAEPGPPVTAEAEPAAEPEPPVTAEAPPTAEAEPPATPEPEAPPRLAVRIEVDFASREALITLDEDADPVRYIYEDGRWRQRPVPS